MSTASVLLVRHCRRRGRTVCRLVGVRHTRAETDSSKLRVVTNETPTRYILRTNRNRENLLGAQTRRASCHVVRTHDHDTVYVTRVFLYCQLEFWLYTLVRQTCVLRQPCPPVRYEAIELHISHTQSCGMLKARYTLAVSTGCGHG